MCPFGAYCPEASSAPYQHLCPIGTFSSRLGLSSVNECTPCTPGMYCDAAGLSAPEGWCSAGYFCGEGSTSRAPQSSNPFSVSYVGDTCINVKNGTINDVCPPGHYCKEGSSSPVACPPGFNTSSLGSGSLSDCQQCTKGMYCPQSGTVLATRVCLRGYFCPSGTVNPADDPDLLCPAGSMCAEGSSIPQPCPLGSYQDSAGQSMCIECPAGYSCGDVSGTVSPRICPVGNRCPLGSSEPLPCSLGTYQDVVGSGVCKSCPAGYYCDVTSGTVSPVQCGVGYACPGGSKTPIACQPGTFQSNSSMPVCATCPASFYCQKLMTVKPLNCPKSYFCPLGSTIPTPCPIGTFSNNINLQSVEDCSPCIPGMFCDSNGLTSPRYTINYKIIVLLIVLHKQYFILFR